MAGPTATTPDLWLDAIVAYHSGTTQATDGQTVVTWPDQSGNGNNAVTGTAPIWHASPSRITFNGSSQFLQNAYTGDPKTFLCVINDGNAANFAEVLGGQYTPGAASALDAYYIGVAGTTIDELGTPFTFKRITTSDPSTGGSATDGVCYAKRVSSAYCFISGRIKNGWVQLYVNGALLAQKLMAGTERVISAAVIGAGYFNHSVTDFWQGSAQAILMYSVALSDAELDSLHSWAASTYSITRWDANVSPQLYRYGGFLGDDPSRRTFSLTASSDGAAFEHRNSYYYPDSGQCVRDPSIIRIGSTYWMAHTTELFPPNVGSTSFAVAKSIDGMATWTKVADVDCSAVSPAHAWAPEWFIDSDGTAYVLWTNGTGLYRIGPTDTTGFTTWGTPAGLTNLTSGDRLDPYGLKVGSTYYCWYAIISGSPVAGIGFATASAITGSWTEVKDGNTDWASWVSAIKTATGAGGISLEGPSFVSLSGGGHRIYFDAYNGSTRYGVWYSDNATDAFSTGAAWTVPLQCTVPSGTDMRHGSMTPNPQIASRRSLTGMRAGTRRLGR